MLAAVLRLSVSVHIPISAVLGLHVAVLLAFGDVFL